MVHYDLFMIRGFRLSGHSGLRRLSGFLGLKLFQRVLLMDSLFIALFVTLMYRWLNERVLVYEGAASGLGELVAFGAFHM